LSVNNIPPFVKGVGEIFAKWTKANPPKSPFFKGGFNGRSLFKPTLLLAAPFGDAFVKNPKVRLSIIDDLVKSPQNDGFVKSSPAAGGTRRAKTEE
jgi:hypothetical protein